MQPTELASAWLAAKEREVAANAERIDIEQKILASLGCPEEGSKTHKLEGTKITTTGKLNYRADIAHLLTLSEQLPTNLRPLKTETRLDETGAKWLRSNDTDHWRLIAPAIVISPAKTSIRIERI